MSSFSAPAGHRCYDLPAMKHSQRSGLAISSLALALSFGLALPAGLGACGGKKDADKPAEDKKADGGAPADAAAAEIKASDLPELGFDQLRRFNYPYGDGAAAFTKATAAYKAKPRDWAAVRTHAEAAIAKDPHHLDAHRMLAAAMAQDGDYTQAATHVLTALAADWTKQGAAAPADADLAGFWSSPAGAKLTATAAKIKEQFLAKASAGAPSGLWLLGRRSTFKLPEKAGVQSATTRGELYAYDRESKRFLRISQTDHSVAGFLRSPSGKELVLIGFDRLEVPAGAAKPAAKPAGGAVTKPGEDAEPPPEPAADPMPTEETGGAPPAPVAGPALKIARGFAVILDAATFEPLGKRISLPKGEQLAIGYAAGERLIAIVTASGAWDGGGEAQWLSIDTTTGKTTKTQPAMMERVVSISATGGDVLEPVAGLRGSPETGANLSELSTESGTAISIPDGATASRRSLSLAPDKARLAFATSPDPCNPDAAPSLYVADAATGAPKHLLTGKSRFLSRWLDATTLAYEDPEGGIRLWDATSGRESLRLADKGGLALAFLAVSAAPACVAAP